LAEAPAEAAVEAAASAGVEATAAADVAGAALEVLSALPVDAQLARNPATTSSAAE